MLGEFVGARQLVWLSGFGKLTAYQATIAMITGGLLQIVSFGRAFGDRRESSGLVPRPVGA